LSETRYFGLKFNAGDRKMFPVSTYGPDLRL
jgi:hypothetical protein